MHELSNYVWWWGARSTWRSKGDGRDVGVQRYLRHDRLAAGSVTHMPGGARVTTGLGKAVTAAAGLHTAKPLEKTTTRTQQRHGQTMHD